MPPRDREPNYYNKGQEDKAKDKFDPPRSPATAPFWSKEDEKDWKDYEAGRKNTENQQKDQTRTRRLTETPRYPTVFRPASVQR